MKRKLIDRRDTHFFSNAANDLVYNQEKLSEFIDTPFSKDAVSGQIEKKSKEFSDEKRLSISNFFMSKYEKVESSDVTQSNIRSLKDSNTFTITTGHQLNLFTGPVFFIYKIMHVIKMCEELNKQNSGNHFVPIYWMASEDHDFEEINHVNLFGNKVSWNSNQNGAVGRFNLSDFDSVREEVKGYFQNNEAITVFLDNTYDNTSNLASATFELVHSLFDSYGLLILDADDSKLKKSFSGILEKELRKGFSGNAVRKTSEILENKGYKAQVHPRDINLFYLNKNSRDRIIEENGKYIIGEDHKVELEELLNLLESNPENFSPNVILRPLYQEFVLPNLCYVGGGGEMAYWLQLKGVFDAANVVYPLIQVRNSVQVVPNGISKRIEKLELTFEDFLQPDAELKKEFVEKNSDDEIDFSDLELKIAEIEKIMLEMVKSNFSGLMSYTESEVTRLKKQLDNFKGKITREQKKKFEISLNQIDKVYDSIFPNNGLSERYDNVLSYFAQFGIKSFLELVHENVDPFEKDLIVIQ